VTYDRDASDHDEQGENPRTKVPGRNNIAAPRYDRLTNANGTRYEAFSADYSEPHYDEAPPLLPGRDDADWQSYPSQPHPGRRRHKFIDEIDDTHVNNIPQPERAHRPILAAIFFVLMALIGSGAATAWFYFGPTTSSEVDRTAATLSRLADDQRKLAQAISALQQLVQDSIQKNTAAREQDMQRLSVETRAIEVDLEGLRAAIANLTAQPRATQAPKRAAVHVQKNGSEHKPAVPSQSDSPPMTLSPAH
jgi:hypothetical protein